MTADITRAMLVDGAAGRPNREVMRLSLVKSDGVTPAFTNVPVVTATAIGTAAKVVATPEPAANTLVLIKFTAGNTAASPTVAFAGGSARAIQLGGTASAAIEITLAANGIAMFFFDGTILHQIGVYS